MKFIKINNATNQFGQWDYKGLDINQIITGSQEYQKDGTICVIATNEEGFSNPDIFELSEVEYITLRNSIKTFNSQDQVTLETRTTELETQNAQMLLALVNGGLM